MKDQSMKKLLVIVLTLTLLGSLGSILAQEKEYMSLFETDFDGWYARSTGGAQLDLVEGSVLITGRSQDWHSPGRDFSLVPGRSYELSVMVYQNEADSATFLISVAHTINGRESYENLARAEVKRGEWTRLSGGYLAGQFDRYVLYVETLGAPGLSFRMKDFSLISNMSALDRDLPSLKELYRDYFDFGCALTGREAQSKELMDFYASQFNIMTHGNELKPDFVLDVARSAQLSQQDPGAVAIRLDAARPLLNYAQAHHIKVHGHVLLWHNQTPEAFFRENYSRTGPYVSREVMLSRMENYIRLVLDQTQREYPGVIVSWDVVNEAIDDNTGKLRQSNWTRVVGEDFILQAFHFARKYAPEGMQLYYNDYSTPYQPKLDGILKVLAQLKEEGTIDGHGFQCHYHLHTPSMQQLQSAMDKVIALGLRLRMSELDILVDSASEENFEKQAGRYDQILTLFREYAQHIDAVHTWGVSDNISWKANHFPLLFDGQGRPKPAFFAITDPLL
jgi:endo-1,4-beta-xylanase